MRLRLPSRLRVGFATVFATLVVLVVAPSSSIANHSHWQDDYSKICDDLVPDNVSCQTGVQIPDSEVPKDHCFDVNWRTAGGIWLGGTRVCIRKGGDIMYVRDFSSDGHSAIGTIRATNWQTTMVRFCKNLYGNATWAYCNFNWEESTPDAWEYSVWAGWYEGSTDQFVISDANLYGDPYFYD